MAIRALGLIAAGVKSGAKSGDWLNRERILAYGGIFLAFEFCGFIILAAEAHGWVGPPHPPVVADFVSFYAAGHLANLGLPAGAYIRSLHWAAEQQVAGPGINYALFVYPPVFLLICGLLARLPYFAALLAFETLTMLLWVATMLHILPKRGGRTDWLLLLPLMAFPAIFINYGVGQNGFLTAALLGGGCLLVDRRPVLAGILFGALCYKPHFGLLVPVALIAGGRFRCFAAAAVTVIALIGLSAAAFGWDVWRSFIETFAGSQPIYSSGQIKFDIFVSPFGALRLLGAGTKLALAAQGVASVAAAAMVAWVWRRNSPLPVRGAVLASATLVAVPLTLYYDLLLAGVAIAWLIQDGCARGFGAWGKSLLLALFLAPGLVLPLALLFRLPVGVIQTVALLALCGAHAVRASDPVGRAAITP